MQNDIVVYNDKIIKEIFKPCKGLSLKHQVSFGNKRTDGKRAGEVNLYEYSTQKYTDVKKLRSIYVSSSDYLILEGTKKTNKTDSSVSVCLSYPHLEQFKHTVDFAKSWFLADEYDELFVEVEDELILNSKFSNLYSFTNKTIEKREIFFKPAIIETETELLEGVILILDEEYSVYLTVDELFSFSYIINRFDLYQSSIQLSTYAYVVTHTNIEVKNNKTKEEGFKEISEEKRRKLKSEINESKKEDEETTKKEIPSKPKKTTKSKTTTKTKKKGETE